LLSPAALRDYEPYTDTVNTYLRLLMIKYSMRKFSPMMIKMTMVPGLIGHLP